MQFSLYNKFAVWDHTLLCVFVSKLIIHQSVLSEFLFAS